MNTIYSFINNNLLLYTLLLCIPAPVRSQTLNVSKVSLSNNCHVYVVTDSMNYYSTSTLIIRTLDTDIDKAGDLLKLMTRIRPGIYTGTQSINVGRNQINITFEVASSLLSDELSKWLSYWLKPNITLEEWGGINYGIPNSLQKSSEPNSLSNQELQDLYSKIWSNCEMDLWCYSPYNTDSIKNWSLILSYINSEKPLATIPSNNTFNNERVRINSALDATICSLEAEIPLKGFSSEEILIINTSLDEYLRYQLLYVKGIATSSLVTVTWDSIPLIRVFVACTRPKSILAALPTLLNEWRSIIPEQNTWKTILNQTALWLWLGNRTSQGRLQSIIENYYNPYHKVAELEKILNLTAEPIWEKLRKHTLELSWSYTGSLNEVQTNDFATVLKPIDKRR